MSAVDPSHLDDDRLLAARTGQLPLRRRERAHLAICPACASRDREWADALSRTREAAGRAVDAAFPPSRLARQREAILRRIARLEPARVLAFPTQPEPATARPRRRRSRWVAAGAAAGLLLGVVTGQYVNLVPDRSAGRRATSAAVRPAPPQIGSLRPVGSIGLEDEFLLQVDSAIGNTQVAELQAIDELTPRVREASIQVR